MSVCMYAGRCLWLNSDGNLIEKFIRLLINVQPCGTTYAELQVADYFLQFFEAAWAVCLPIEQDFLKVVELGDGKPGLH